VLIPHDNVKDLAEIPENIKEKLDIRPVKWIDEVFEMALTHMPAPLIAELEAIADKRGRRAPKRGTKQPQAH
jgi:ATP-dependent Lon protease